ncbi:hypothetical protein TcWFU_002397 [Taenia crassiceps]|uniref:Uncharacterized protein n=1 Tax=Taenia crassiceps TaxID=6207 RepID=A0ABR4Q724_9CEST
MDENNTPMQNLGSTGRPNVRSFEVSPPEVYRGEALSIRSDSPYLTILRDPHVEVKNSTICFEGEAKNLDSLSGLFPSTELSPISCKLPSSSYSTFEITCTTEMEESTGDEDKPDVIRNSQGKTKFDFCFSPIPKQRQKTQQRMSAVCEVTEPLSEGVSAFDAKMQTLAVCEESEISPIQRTPAEWQAEDVSEIDESETDENIPVTPEGHLIRKSESLASRMEQLLWAPLYSPSKEISEESDDFVCSSGEISPPIMRLYMPKGKHEVLRQEHVMQWKSTQTDYVPLTVEKGTQTLEECEMPEFPDVIDNEDANRLKEWIEKLFKHRLPMADPQPE